ncbi:hypothetical protein DFJ74DRAFT_674811 [Hyaloraphidium curvatum]|nr:hypothetical protein DFJ74DRAFT_674811 [Hyaloraphidium curvatum]
MVRVRAARPCPRHAVTTEANRQGRLQRLRRLLHVRRGAEGMRRQAHAAAPPLFRVPAGQQHGLGETDLQQARSRARPLSRHRQHRRAARHLPALLRQGRLRPRLPARHRVRRCPVPVGPVPAHRAHRVRRPRGRLRGLLRHAARGRQGLQALRVRQLLGRLAHLRVRPAADGLPRRRRGRPAGPPPLPAAPRLLPARGRAALRRPLGVPQLL